MLDIHQSRCPMPSQMIRRVGSTTLDPAPAELESESGKNAK
jgi:hypothetical protein